MPKNPADLLAACVLDPEPKLWRGVIELPRRFRWVFASNRPTAGGQRSQKEMLFELLIAWVDNTSQHQIVGLGITSRAGFEVANDDIDFFRLTRPYLLSLAIENVAANLRYDRAANLWGWVAQVRITGRSGSKAFGDVYSLEASDEQVDALEKAARLGAARTGHLTPADLQEVARVYQLAQKKGLDTQESVRSHFGLKSASAAANRIKKARECGFLPMTSRSKPRKRKKTVKRPTKRKVGKK